MDRIIFFKLCGKFAHFRKFYTNSSSLSYLVPPRTVVIGLLASILKIPRDEYYEIFSEDRCKISVSVSPGIEIRKQTQSMNYFHTKYFDLIAKGNPKGLAQHSQCKLELLMASENGYIEYCIYIGYCSDNDTLLNLEQHLAESDFGYGLYMGQRQFRGFIGDFRIITDFKFLPESEYLDSICVEENWTDFTTDGDIRIISEQMPIHFKKVVGKKQTGREPTMVKRVYFESSGKRLKGAFKNCYLLEGDRYISFY
ncbi:CRISPR-associated protein Cas5 [bacterium]|nr:CRISPR-associated protein Cas5 [bacterium]MBU1635224.1 CRISPR-associated protein Cas5 [bacterium]